MTADEIVRRLYRLHCNDYGESNPYDYGNNECDFCHEEAADLHAADCLWLEIERYCTSSPRQSMLGYRGEYQCQLPSDHAGDHSHLSDDPKRELYWNDGTTH